VAPLVTLTEAKVYLGPTDAADDALLQTLIDAVIALLAEQCGRASAPWTTTGLTARTEILDGTGTPVLWLDYPATTVTTIAIGFNPSTPDETLDASDATKVSWVAGSAQVVRVDGGVFACYGDRRRVRVTYDTQADAPVEAKLAVNRVVAALYQQRGAEDATTERTGTTEVQLAQIADSDAVWQQVVAAIGRRVF
jgi:hypothetical protein